MSYIKLNFLFPTSLLRIWKLYLFWFFKGIYYVVTILVNFGSLFDSYSYLWYLFKAILAEVIQSWESNLPGIGLEFIVLILNKLIIKYLIFSFVCRF